MSIAPRSSQLIFKFLRNAGGSLAMNAATPAPFYWQVPTGRAAEITRVMFVIVDGAMGYGEFGGLLSALTNGLKIEVQNSSGTTLIDFLDGQTLKTNEEFNLLAGVDGVIHPAAGDDLLPIRWTIAKAVPESRGLILDSGDKFVVTTQDNLSGLTVFKTMIQGRYY